MAKSCSIFFYEGYIDTAPTIVSLAKALDECAYTVNIYTTKHQTSNSIKLSEHVKIILFTKSSEVPAISFLHKLFKVKFSSLIPVIDLIAFFVQCVMYFIGQSFSNNEFACSLSKEDVNIGVDRIGSILSLVKARLFNQKVVYLSLELNEPKTFGKAGLIMTNRLERLTYQTSACVLVQDEDRFKTLSEFNQYQHPKVFYLPNSPYYSSFSPQDSNYDGNYFRDMFGLSEEDYSCIVLHAGMINEFVCSGSLASAFSAMNKNYALVFNSSWTISEDDVYVRTLSDSNKKNLFLSLNPLPYAQIHRVFESATIGLVFYQNVDNNFSQISMASGKLAHFLKHGKPVLVSDLESLSKLVEKYKFGIVIQDPSNSVELENAIEVILNDYELYSRNARLCFDEEFDFGKKVKPFLSFMAKYGTKSLKG